MTKITINSDYITLGQFLKFAGIISNGGEAKSFLQSNKILVDGNEENRRGRKLFGGETIKINDDLIIFVEKK